MITSDEPLLLVKVNIHQGVGTIILNRADRGNALSRQLVAEMQQTLLDLHQQRSVRAIVLTGSGSVFCSGCDLAEIHASSREENAESQWHHDCTQLRDLLETMLRYPKPIIAAVNGAAMGTGASLLLTADVVVAGPDAIFGAPEPQRGLVAGLVAPLLIFRIGAGRTANLLISARDFSPDEALQAGIYHELVATDKVWAKAVQWAEQCARGAPESLQLTRSLINETIGEQLITWLSAGAAATATARTTEAAAEGVAAFLEKRPPIWP